MPKRKSKRTRTLERQLNKITRENEKLEQEIEKLSNEAEELIKGLDLSTEDRIQLFQESLVFSKELGGPLKEQNERLELALKALDLSSEILPSSVQLYQKGLKEKIENHE